MAWSGCNTTSEYIELMNFGPGPMNIGCYIVTNGQYAVTIPPNTIVQPGQYFLISGQNVLAKDCGNRDSAVNVDLNWTTCNCANTTIPTTGDGFMQDGGSANEKVVLLDPNFKVIDAVSRQSTPSSSIAITTSSLSGACTSRTFDLDTMAIAYETIGESTGIDNSYSRKVDGDCGWVKTTQISAHAPNKTNSTSSATYSFNAINTTDCSQYNGSISITVSAASGSVASYFPMEYTLAHDVDSNWIYNSADTYSYGIDNTSPNIDIANLSYGRYRITVASSLGCNLKSFDFYIFNCYTVLLPLKLLSFKYVGVTEGLHIFQGQLTGADNLKKIVLEGEKNGVYQTITTIYSSGENGLFSISAPVSSYTRYRLRLVDKKDAVSYSSIISIKNQTADLQNRFWPNPAKESINFNLSVTETQSFDYKIYSLSSSLVKKGSVVVKKENPESSISLAGVVPGLYQMVLSSPVSSQPITFRFVKQ